MKHDAKEEGWLSAKEKYWTSISPRIFHIPFRQKTTLDLSHKFIFSSSSVLPPILYKYWYVRRWADFETIQTKTEYINKVKRESPILYKHWYVRQQMDFKIIQTEQNKLKESLSTEGNLFCVPLFHIWDPLSVCPEKKQSHQDISNI